MSNETEDVELRGLRNLLVYLQEIADTIEANRVQVVERIKERRRALYEATKQPEPIA